MDPNTLLICGDVVIAFAVGWRYYDSEAAACPEMQRYRRDSRSDIIIFHQPNKKKRQLVKETLLKWIVNLGASSDGSVQEGESEYPCDPNVYTGRPGASAGSSSL